MEFLSAVAGATSIHLDDIEASQAELTMDAVPPVEGTRGKRPMRSGIDVLDDGILHLWIERMWSGDDAPDVELAVAILGDERHRGRPAGFFERIDISFAQLGDGPAVCRAAQGVGRRLIDPRRGVNQRPAVGREGHFVVSIGRGQVDERAPWADPTDMLMVRVLAGHAA